MERGNVLWLSDEEMVNDFWAPVVETGNAQCAYLETGNAFWVQNVETGYAFETPR